MAKAINCPQCNGKGYLSKQKQTTTEPNGDRVEVEVIELCPNRNCNDGVIVIEDGK